jgi:hypothetical protein
MSIFQTDNSIARPSDGAINYRVTEVSADGSATSGQLKFRWQSSANQYWLPRNSYVMIKVKFADGTSPFTATELTAAGGLQLTSSPGDAMFSLVQHQMNGTLVGSSNEPAVDGIVMKRAFMKEEVRQSFGDLQYLNMGDEPLDGVELDIMYTPPLGLWATDSVGGASHVLSLTTHANLIERLVAVAALRATNVMTAEITSVKLMVAHASPEVPVPVSRTTVINTIDISTQSFSHSVNGNSSAQISVPPSTRKMFVSTQLSSLAATDARGACTLNGVPVTQLSVSFAGQESPVLAYSGSTDDARRKYYDFNREKFMLGISAFDTLEEHTAAPITAHHFAKTTSDVSTSATIRLTANGSTYPSNVYVSSLSHNAIVTTYNSSGYVEGVNFIVVN